MSDNWARLMQPVDVGGMVAQGFQQGQKTREQNMAKAAMAALVQDPSNAKALAALAQVDPERAMEFRKQQIEQAKAHVGEHYDNIVRGAQILREVNPKDQPSYDRARALAAQAGVDISQVPPTYDPSYVEGVVHLADAFKPQTEHNPQVVPVAPGGGVATIDPATHGLQFLAMPNDGSHPAGAPVGNVPHVTDEASYNAVPPGGQYVGPDGHMRVKQGGQTPPASGNF